LTSAFNLKYGAWLDGGAAFAKLPPRPNKDCLGPVLLGEQAKQGIQKGLKKAFRLKGEKDGFGTIDGG
jgi:hypothetical protein